MSDNIDKPRHDQLFRKAFENPLVALEFMNTHLPKEVLKILDISTLKLEKDTFVNLTLTDSACDVLFSAKFNGTDGFIHILLEHQSSCDRFMAFRLFKYMLSICDQYLTSKPKAKHLPLIYPIVIYNGEAKYNAPLNIWQLFNNWLKLQKRDNSELEARILLKTSSFCKTILTLNHNTPSTHPL